MFVPPSILLGFNHNARLMYTDSTTGKIVVKKHFSDMISPKFVKNFLNYCPDYTSTSGDEDM